MWYIISHIGFSSVAHKLLLKIREGLSHIGLSHALDGVYDKWIYLVIVVVCALVMVFVLQYVVLYLLKRLSDHHRMAFIDEIINSQLIARTLWIIPPLAVHIMLPFAFDTTKLLHDYLQRVCNIFIVCVVVNSINTFITILWNIFYTHSKLRNRPIKGVLQIVHGVIIACGCIISVSIFIDKTPTVLFTGLGAFAAVLMLIFKDTILGFVAGIQIVQYDMVRNGDWITLPGTIVDGVVTDVSLNTVKVRNYDNTTIMLPPYTLVSQPLQNWRGMSESGGRRIMQSIVIDLNSIQFCNDSLMQKLSTQPIIKDFISNGKITTYNPLEGGAPLDALRTDSVETNLGLFRMFLWQYLLQHPDIQHTGYTLLVRTLEPDTNGIPLQIYCFTTTTRWEQYEIIQSQIMEYIAAILPLFELFPFQNASARDYILQSLVSQGYKPKGFDL